MRDTAARKAESKLDVPPSFPRWTSGRLDFRAAVSLNLRNTNEKHIKEPPATHAQARFTALRTGIRNVVKKSQVLHYSLEEKLAIVPKSELHLEDIVIKRSEENEINFKTV